MVTFFRFQGQQSALGLTNKDVFVCGIRLSVASFLLIPFSVCVYFLSV